MKNKVKTNFQIYSTFFVCLLIFNIFFTLFLNRCCKEYCPESISNIPYTIMSKIISMVKIYLFKKFLCNE